MKPTDTPLIELSQDPFNETEQTENNIATTIEYLERRINSGHWMLDLGRESPLTRKVKERFKLRIENTVGDLDTITMGGAMKYDFILYSHTIEHQFNPLHTLVQLKKLMRPDSVMFIILPNKPKFLWWEGHYHEIDRYRMELLLKRAELRIISYERHRVRRQWSFYLKGVRPLMRLFLEYNDYYEVQTK